jgi:hypothetical protein
MLALPVSGALGSVQDKLNESRIPVPASAERGFAGEIRYAFDTALNMTTARFKTSLAPRGIFSRIFRASPTVHTLTAAYEFAGRGAGNTPDSIRISLISDEFLESSSGNGLPQLPAPVLAITLGDSVARFPLGISQKTEVWWPNDTVRRAARSYQAVNAGMNVTAPAPQMHVTRNVTVRLSTCAFLSLIARKDVHGTAARLDFDLNEDVIAGLREFAAGMAADTARLPSVSCRAR